MKVDHAWTKAPELTGDGLVLAGGDTPPEADKPKPSGLRLVLADNKAFLAPFGWMAAVDASAFAIHHGTASPWHALGYAAGASAAVTAGSLWRVRASRLKKKIKTARTRHSIQQNVKVALVAGSLWELIAATWTPLGPHGAVQYALLGGGIAAATPHWWRNRRRGSTPAPTLPLQLEAPAETIPQAQAPVEDPRLTEFRSHFCTSGVLKGARLYDLQDVPAGFRFCIELSLAHRGTYSNVKNIEDELAAFYDVPADHVSVELPENRSVRRAVVTILTDANAHQRRDDWDGESTYNPEDGTFRAGWYADSTNSRWRTHVPGSGAAGGIVVGVPGSGKTGTLHVVAGESGQAKLCRTCLAEKSCPECDPGRICAVWMADPQQQPFGVWRKRADLMAWGPKATVRMLSWMHAAMRYRADHMGRMQWTDHLGRENEGKGWFDPTPSMPMILAIIDEWPIIAKDEELAPLAAHFVTEIVLQGRKVGFSLILGSQEADVDMLGDRAIREALTAYNTMLHQCDSYGKKMLGTEGNPVDLPPGVPGLGYFKGVDQRSGIRHRTKYIPEYLRPGDTGIDVREITERIARDPITYDESVLRAITKLGYTGRGQILDEDDAWDLSMLEAGNDATFEADAGEQDTPPIEPKFPAGAVNQELVAAVRTTLSTRRTADVYDLMEATGSNVLDVERALDQLINAGHAMQNPSGDYAPCH